MYLYMYIYICTWADFWEIPPVDGLDERAYNAQRQLMEVLTMSCVEFFESSSIFFDY